MKSLSKVLATILIVLTSIVQGPPASSLTNLQNNSLSASAGVVSPKYQSCVDYWQPDYIKYTQMLEYDEVHGVIYAWSNCFGSKFIDECQTEIHNLWNSVDQIPWMVKWKTYLGQFKSCGKEVLTTYPPCKKVHPRVSTPPKLIGDATIVSELEYVPAVWTSDNSVTIDWYLNGKKLKAQTDKYRLYIDESWVGKSVSVRESLDGSSCFYSASVKTRSLRIKNSAIKPAPKHFAPPLIVHSKGLWNFDEIRWPDWWWSDKDHIDTVATVNWKGESIVLDSQVSPEMFSGVHSGDIVPVVFKSRFKNRKPLIQTVDWVAPKQLVRLNVSTGWDHGASCKSRIKSIRVSVDYGANSVATKSEILIPTSKFNSPSPWDCNVNTLFYSKPAGTSAPATFTLEIVSDGYQGFCQQKPASSNLKLSSCSGTVAIYRGNIQLGSDWHAWASLETIYTF